MEGTNFLLLIGTNTFVRVFNSNNTNLNMTRYLKNMEKENKILIFRTSITRKCDIKRIEKLLAQYPQIDKWNVDFEDWEKILRIECSGITALEISEVLRNNHIFTSELE